MKAQLALAALLFAGVAHLAMAAPAAQDDTTRVWSEWKASHNKQYLTPQEEADRMAIFLANKQRVDEHNAKFNKGDASYTMSLNPFSDLTNEEFRLRNGHGMKPTLLRGAAQDQEWTQWKAAHNKQYESAAEEGRRYSVFQDNKIRVAEHNDKFAKGEVSYSMGLNAFSDLTSEEFKQRNGHGVHKKEDLALKQQWADWKSQHNKQYETPAEEARRFAIFQENQKAVEEHNAKFSKGEVTYSTGLNAFSDLTHEEFKQRHTGLRPKRSVQNDDATAVWADWKSTHNKQYETPAEDARRFAIFQENQKAVEEHNAKFNKGEVSYSIGLNQFSDLTSDEFRQRHTGFVMRPKRNVQNDDATAVWADWKSTHNKQYETPAEDARRFAIFQENQKAVEEHNAKFNKGEVSYSMGLNQFSDLTSDEFRQRHTGFVMRPKRDVQTDDATAVWADWKSTHNKQYETPAEDARRFAIFQDNQKAIKEHNAKFAKGEVTYSMGLNGFSDLTHEEFKQRYTGGARMPAKRAVQNLDAAAIKEWAEWKATHNKQYETPAEEARRYALFLENKKRVDEHNAKFAKGEVTYSMGLNAFSDLTSDEFKQRNGHGVHKKEDLALKQEWSEWKSQHNKQYETPAEEARRYALFQENKKRVDEHNAKFAKGEVTFSMGLNAFSDLTSEEFKQRNGHGVHKKEDFALNQQWADWKSKHNKQYETPAEEARRFAIFQENQKAVEEHNAKFAKGEVTYSMGLNAFSDLISDEFKQRNGHGVHKKEDLALKQEWAEWKSQHNKQYETPAEEARRYSVFQENKKRVDEHNAKFEKGEVSFSMGLNSFSDLTSDELKQRFGRGVLPRKHN